MPYHTIKVTGVSDELLSLIDQKVRRRLSPDRSEYIRELIFKDVLADSGEPGSRSFREIVAPIYAETARLGVSEEDVDRLVEEERSNLHVEKLGISGP